MKRDLLEKHIVGAPVIASIAGSERPLQYTFAAVIAYQDRTGDSLFDRESYSKIDPRVDPKRWLACLWAGLHVAQDDGTWESPFTIDELSGLVRLDSEQVGELSLAMVKALAACMPQPKGPVPNEPAPADVDRPAPESASENSGDEPASTTASPDANS